MKSNNNLTNNTKKPAYKDPSLPIEKRVDDLVSRLTLEEKVSQMVNNAPAIDRLDIPEYDWWNECLHGVGRAGIATVFPQAIGLASTWNTNLMFRVATAISDEARAKHHEFLRNDNRSRYTGLTFWSPNINIFRDPRWGRGQETYGEDPYLTARMGVAFVKGLQGDDPCYLKLVATPKHFAVHSGPESERHHFDARVDERDLRETYLPAFKACVQEAKAVSVMTAYNRTNGEACCASKTLLEDILRNEWGFDGYAVSDCGAIRDIYRNHRLVETPEEAAALAVNAGCDLNCGNTYTALRKAVEQGLISEETIDRSLKRLFTARFRLGMFDPTEMAPYAQIPYEVNDCQGHRDLALQVARESIVLLKNEDNFLPLDKNLKSIAVIGPDADWLEVLFGNYNGIPSKAVTPLEGIRNKVAPQTALTESMHSKTEVLYAKGCEVTGDSTTGFVEAVEIARKSDVVIAVVGLSQEVEGEEGQREGVGAGKASKGDRVGLDLPGVQEDLLKEIHATGKPIVVVLINGSPISVNWANENVPAIIEAWYPGEEGGTAIADVLFGDYNPGGRLPITFYKSLDQLPPFEDYNMEGRTYRYSKEKPLFSFGYGLSYTKFEYSNLQLSSVEQAASLLLSVDVQNVGDCAGDEVVHAVEQAASLLLSVDVQNVGDCAGNEVVHAVEQAASLLLSVDVQNVGDCAGNEVVQLYVSDVVASVPVPIRQLQGFERIYLGPGEKKTVTFTLTPSQMSLIDDNGKRVVEPGEFKVAVGGNQPDDGNVLIDSFEVVG